ncbi:MAG: phospholipid carrier-dependent glycosyltransferase [Flavobacteriales bacterium]|nr:phospholipid carrier-dependent glycosyltransferase [Flavobacteriales bacterium]
MNGLNIANGNWEIGHIDHPGTPVQLLMGLFTYITFLFSGIGDIVTDTLKRPEHYIRASTLFFVVLKFIVHLFTGYKIFNVFNRLNLALFFQTIPFLILFRINGFTTVNPDVLLDSIYLLFAVVCTSLYWQKQQKPANQTTKWRDIVSIALILGCALATKLTSLCLMIIPVFLFTNWIDRAKLVGSIVAAFYFFTIPIFSQLDKLFGFVSGIASHSGQYGTGDSGVPTLSHFMDNITEMLSAEYTLPLGFILSLILVFLSLTKNPRSLSEVLFSLSILCAYSFQFLIVGKHYAVHYTMPLHFLTVPVLLLTGYNITNRVKPLFTYQSRIAHLGLVLLIIVALIRVGNFTELSKINSSSYLETMAFLDKNVQKKEPLLLFSGAKELFLTGSLPQQGLWFGRIYSGYLTRWKRSEQLESIYPGNYFFHPKSGKFENWYGNIPIWKIMQQHSELFIYSRTKSAKQIQQSLRSTLGDNIPKKLIQLQLIYTNVQSGETIYKASIDSSWAQGSYSLALDLNNIFTGTINLEPSTEVKIKDYAIQPGDYLEVTVWRKADNTKNFIELKTTTGFRHHSGAVIARNGEWEKVFIKFEVPKKFSDRIAIHIRNASDSLVIYDKLELKIWRNEELSI